MTREISANFWDNLYLINGIFNYLCRIIPHKITAVI